MSKLRVYFFTYGTEGHPFRGGWTEVEAPNVDIAVELFKAVHPNREPGILLCAGIYSEAQFRHTSMFSNGNFGARCHERIILRREMGDTE